MIVVNTPASTATAGTVTDGTVTDGTVTAGTIAAVVITSNSSISNRSSSGENNCRSDDNNVIYFDKEITFRNLIQSINKKMDYSLLFKTLRKNHARYLVCAHCVNTSMARII